MEFQFRNSQKNNCIKSDFFTLQFSLLFFCVCVSFLVYVICGGGKNQCSKIVVRKCEINQYSDCIIFIKQAFLFLTIIIFFSQAQPLFMHTCIQVKKKQPPEQLPFTHIFECNSTHENQTCLQAFGFQFIKNEMKNKLNIAKCRFFAQVCLNILY